MLPIVYTPTVGEAVERFSHVFETPRGMSVMREDSDDIASVVAGYPCKDARMIVATDSSAVLGSGDQGYNGLASAIGKLALYTSGGGVSPFRTVPAVLHVGTDREDLLADPLYLGLSGQSGAFAEAVVRSLASNSERPIVFALSNPTVSCEAHPADLLAWTSGRALVATGSPFDPVVRDGITHVIEQSNNAFIFPGLGFGAMLAGARSITDRMVESAALALADYTSERWLAEGLLYPPIEDLREASVRVAVAGALPEDIEAHVRATTWRPRYLPFKRAAAGESP